MNSCLLILTVLSTISLCINGDELSATKNIASKHKACLSEREVDQNFLYLLTFGNSSRLFPESSEQMIKYCRDNEKYTQALEGFSKDCPHDEFVKKTVSIFIKTIRYQMNPYCRAANSKKMTKKLKNFLEASTCANWARNPIQRCAENAILSLQDTLKMKNQNDQIKSLCCHYSIGLECQMKATNVENQFCNENRAKNSLAILESITDNSVNFVCGNLDSDVCDKYAKATPISKTLKYKTIFIPMIKILGGTQ